MWRQRLVPCRPASCRHYVSSPVLHQSPNPARRQPVKRARKIEKQPVKRTRKIEKIAVYTSPSDAAAEEKPAAFSPSDADYIRINNGTFYRSYPSESDGPGANPPLISNLRFSLPGKDVSELNGKLPPCCAVISPSAVSRTTLLQVLAGQYLCVPPDARTYPHLSALHLSPASAIKYVGFDAERGNSVSGTSMRGAYLSARYESRREETDFSVRDYLIGHTELNALDHTIRPEEQRLLDKLVKQLDLANLLGMPVANLSNGQTRRARIAKALMSQPKVLLLDAPFMGLDPNTRDNISKVLRNLAKKDDLRLVLSLRPDDKMPAWLNTHLVIDPPPRGSKPLVTKNQRVTADGYEQEFPVVKIGEAVVEMQGVKVTYGKKTVLGDWTQNVGGEKQEGLWWTLHRGQRCGIFGPNGSGKTTMLSLITSDHPQTYSLPIKLFGRSRLPASGEQGISVFDLQKRMGHCSPEVHSFFPKQLTVRRVLESAWADAPLARPKLTAAIDRRVDGYLRWFARELNPLYPGRTLYEQLEVDTQPVPRGLSPAAMAKKFKKTYPEMVADDSDIAWADSLRFSDLNFASQRLVLFLRAIVAQPDLVILDEALSGVDQHTKEKALLFLSHGQKLALSQAGRSMPQTSMLSRVIEPEIEGLTAEQALLVISHTKDDVPGCIREWICLPEPGRRKPPKTGRLEGPLSLMPQGWDEIWGRKPPSPET